MVDVMRISCIALHLKNEELNEGVFDRQCVNGLSRFSSNSKSIENHTPTKKKPLPISPTSISSNPIKPESVFSSMALETWLIKVKTTLLQKKPLFSSSKPKRLAVLSFEMANVMSKLFHLWQSLSDASMVRLRNDVVALEGVQKLISNDESFLMSLAVAKFADSLRLVADSVKEEKGCEEGKGWFKFREERVKGPSVFVGKVESFEDDEYGGRPDKPVLMSQNSRGDSESGEEFGGDESDSEDGETSDEDFRVDEDGVEIEWSSSEESDTSSYDDDDEKMVKRRERNVGSATEDYDMKTKSRTKKMQNHLSEKMVKGRVRKMESATESSGV
ncbi:hypothetical protein Fmac_001840 [Flemingia macrophylla]|uniref:DUF3475 domain-containing protein n=1 Tax=Flemingia macrophylla TaxID=520843 RepID=A0ABD1NL21_9FABA